MATVYGATPWEQNNIETNIRYDFIGKNSEVFAPGDVVVLASGVLKVVSAATDIPVGVAVKTQTMASNNQTVAKVRPGFIPFEGSELWRMSTDGDMTGDVTDSGTYYGLNGSTGAILVAQSSGVTTTTSRQVVIVRVDPTGAGGTGSGSGLRDVLVRFTKMPWLNIAAT